MKLLCFYFHWKFWQCCHAIGSQVGCVGFVPNVYLGCFVETVVDSFQEVIIKRLKLGHDAVGILMYGVVAIAGDDPGFVGIQLVVEVSTSAPCLFILPGLGRKHGHIDIGHPVFDAVRVVPGVVVRVLRNLNRQ